MSKLTTRERVICGAALLAFISAFLPWQAFQLEPSTLNVDGWSAGLMGAIGVLLLTAAGVYLLLRRLEYAVYAPPFGDTPVVAGLATTGLVLVIVRWTTLPSSYGIYGSSAGTRYGLWLAVAAGAVETALALAEVRDLSAVLPSRRSRS